MVNDSEMKGEGRRRQLTHTQRTFVRIYMVSLYMAFAGKVVVELVLVLLMTDSLIVDCFKICVSTILMTPKRLLEEENIRS